MEHIFKKILFGLVLIIMACSVMFVGGITKSNNIIKNDNLNSVKNQLPAVLSEKENELSNVIYQTLYGKGKVKLNVAINNNEIEYSQSILYDFEDFPTFLLIQYPKNGYLIMDRISEII